MRGKVLGAMALVLVALAAPGGPAAAADGGPAFRINDLIGTGCQPDQVAFHAITSGMAEHEGFAVRTRAVSGGLTYTDELADVEGGWTDETYYWSLLDINNYPGAPTANRGTWPIPQDQPVVITLTLEQPTGVVVHSWTSVLSKCNGGVFTQNGPSDPAQDADGDGVPLDLDACPTLPAPTGDGCPTRALNLTVTPAGQLAGTLVSGAGSATYANVKVHVWRVVRGALDIKVAVVRSSATGSFHVSSPGPGNYYATTPRVVLPSGDTFIKTRSANLKIR
jgi:hypothetical protein